MTKDKFIVLTHEMIRDDSMTMQEKIIYLEILNLSSLDKGCIASNSHFEKCFGISKKSVSNTISSLVQKGFIEVDLKDRNHTRTLSIKNGQVSIKNGQVSIKNGETKENKTDNKTIEVNPLTFGEFTKYDFQLKKQVSFDKLSKEYLSKLEIEIDDHNEKLMLKRLNVNSPLTETLSFREFSIKFLSNGRKQTNFWTKFLEYEQYTFENEAKKKGIR